MSYVDIFQEKSYYALAAFCENMGEEILPFLEPLMGKLLAALQSSPRNLQETCMVQVLHAPRSCYITRNVFYLYILFN